MKYFLLLLGCLMLAGCPSYDAMVDYVKKMDMEKNQTFPARDLRIIECDPHIGYSLPCRELPFNVEIPYRMLSEDFQECEWRKVNLPRNTAWDFRHLKEAFKRGKIHSTSDEADCDPAVSGMSNEELRRRYP